MKKLKPIVIGLIIVGILVLTFVLIESLDFAVLNTKGTIADSQRQLILFASFLSLVIVVPVFALTFTIAWRYREGNKKAKYRPDWDHNKIIEGLWWGVPLVLILILSVVAWRSSHQLDPFKPLESETKQMTIQVVALQWKWLFIYPEQDIATVNYVQFPADTPVKFVLTSDAPMNSFWVPQLGGQVYAMSGMTTSLHLEAKEPGMFKGVSANISGKGFADMKFNAVASSSSDFAAWVQEVKNSPQSLDLNTYNSLAKPGVEADPIYYASAKENLYDIIVLKYMLPGMSSQSYNRASHH